MTGNGGMEIGSAWPRTRFGSLDVLADVPHELSAQIGDGGEDATGDDVPLDPGEPQFDLVEPGRVSRREVQPDTIKRRAMGKMRAVQVAQGGGALELVEREMPEPTQGEVRVRVEACGVCHSDSLTVEGQWPGLSFPQIPGQETSMATASDTGNPPRPLAPRLRVGDGIPVFSLPNTSGVSVSSTVLLEPGPLIITFYRGIWCPYCRSDLMALMNATFEVQSGGGSLAAIARETAPNSNRRFQQQHRVDFPILNDATAAVARSFGIGWTEAYLQSLYDQFVADRTGDSPEPSWIEPMQARYVVARDGTIAYVDINTDYRVAPELAAAMAALRRL